MFMIRFSGVMVKIPRGKKIKDLSCFGGILQCDNNQKLFVEIYTMYHIYSFVLLPPFSLRMKENTIHRRFIVSFLPWCT